MYRVLDCIKNEHDYRLVLLAVVICAATSWTTWYLYKMSASSGGLSRWAWVVQTAVAAGSGIWATHFIAMLAFQSALPVTYDAFLTLISLLIAILLTGLGFGVAELRLEWGWIASGVLTGSCIAVMHYTGMSAISIAKYIRWDPVLVIGSIATGVVFASASVWAFQVRNSILLAAGLLTGAICSLHFTAMGAATLQFDPTVLSRHPQIDNALLATAIAAVTLLVMLSGLTAALVNHDTARELSHRADHDQLTGLPNRGYINRMIDSSISSGSESGFALLFIDLDRFKAINDRYGHVVGDDVLREAAERLRRATSETASVARVGGDEFLVFHAGSEPTSTSKLAHAIICAFAEPFEINGYREELGVSVGLALYPRDGKDGKTLLRAADSALYRVKRAGGGAALAA